MVIFYPGAITNIVQSTTDYYCWIPVIVVAHNCYTGCDDALHKPQCQQYQQIERFYYCETVVYYHTAQHKVKLL